LQFLSEMAVDNLTNLPCQYSIVPSVFLLIRVCWQLAACEIIRKLAGGPVRYPTLLELERSQRYGRAIGVIAGILVHYRHGRLLVMIRLPEVAVCLGITYIVLKIDSAILRLLEWMQCDVSMVASVSGRFWAEWQHRPSPKYRLHALEKINRHSVRPTGRINRRLRLHAHFWVAGLAL
jgi:hypothetical protein